MRRRLLLAMALAGAILIFWGPQIERLLAQVPVGAQDILGQLVVGIQGVGIAPANPLKAGSILFYAGPRWVITNGAGLPTTCSPSGTGAIYNNSGTLKVC
jgi:hypothetical protein